MSIQVSEGRDNIKRIWFGNGVRGPWNKPKRLQGARIYAVKALDAVTHRVNLPFRKQHIAASLPPGEGGF